MRTPSIEGTSIVGCDGAISLYLLWWRFASLTEQYNLERLRRIENIKLTRLHIHVRMQWKHKGNTKNKKFFFAINLGASLIIGSKGSKQ